MKSQFEESLFNIVSATADTFAELLVKLACILNVSLPEAYSKLKVSHTKSKTNDILEQTFSNELTPEFIKSYFESAELDAKIQLFVDIAAAIENDTDRQTGIANLIYRKTDQAADDLIQRLVGSGEWVDGSIETSVERVIDACGSKEDAIREILDF